jgi:GNAT superfamily N-acetyltransferase
VSALRRATPADAPALAAVHVQTRGVHWPFLPPPPQDEVECWLRDELIPRVPTWLLQVEDAVLAFLSLQLSDDETLGEVLWIRNLYVAHDHVGQGHGSRLLAFALAPEQRGGRTVRLWTFQANAKGRRFYERHGFVAVLFTDGAENMERCPDVLYELRADQHER